VRVLNEREVRASAGILFVLLFYGASEVAFKGYWVFAELFTFIFAIEFFIRVFINPRFAPFMILGRLIVSNQTPEYVGAVQKRWAWLLGFLMALSTLILISMNIVNNFRVVLCLFCLIFLFVESAFGICMGCKLYTWITKTPSEYCPGGTCEIKKQENITKTPIAQLIFLAIFLYTTYTIYPYIQDKSFFIYQEEDFDDIDNKFNF